MEIQAGNAAIGLYSQLFTLSRFSEVCLISSSYENQNEAFSAYNSSIFLTDNPAPVIEFIKSCTRQ